MEISKLTAAAASQTNELQVALASLNLDFSLVKIQAPQEYKAVGKHISASRKQNAEEGPVHRTARKLDVLVGSMVTPPELLFRTYGQRVSEISASTTFNPRGSRKDGMFKEHVGADSTTIWAAATSGKGALAVQLLACMLARLWTPAEATSIWVEIVQRRKEQILTEYNSNEPSHYPLIQASHFEISRSELASWDSGARAWLAVADAAKSRQHTQLRLIIENLSISVNNKLDVFSGVVSAWKTAMEMVENLLKGISQRVDNGTVLLALSAWHLFPDMIVFREKNQTIEQKDALIPKGGCLTIGLEDADPSKRTGVYWSLSLAHLRFYGDPVVCHRSVAEDASRVSFDQFKLVVLGCFLQRWCSWTQDGLEILSATRLITSLVSIFHRPNSGEESFDESTMYRSLGWLGVLADACRTLEHASDDDRSHYENLVRLGTRRGSSFLSPVAEHPPRLFGLSAGQQCWQLLRDDAEIRLDVIRAILSDDEQFKDKTIFTKYEKTFQGTKWHEIATVTPIVQFSSSKQHVRWIPKCLAPDIFQERTSKLSGLGETYKTFDKEAVSISESFIVFDIDSDVEIGPDDIPLSDALSDGEAMGEAIERVIYDVAGEDWPLPLFSTDCELVLDPIDVDVSIGRLVEFLNKNNFDKGEMYYHLSHYWLRKASPDFARSMKALASFEDVYRSLKEATISLGVLGKELGKRKWVPSQTSPGSMHKTNGNNEWGHDFVFVSVNEPNGGAMAEDQLEEELTDSEPEDEEYFERWHLNALPFIKGHKMSMANALSCVAFFETGTLDLSPESFGNVLAISSGNSIFASRSILCDPWDDPKPHELQRLTANIGRPGISFLIPPTKPKMRQAEFESWKVVNHEPFDGTAKDHFSNTSIQLSFTKYESPVPGAIQHGAQDVEANYIETLIQVYEGPKWVADIDIVAALQSDLINRMVNPTECLGHVFRRKPGFPAASLDSWAEIIDYPSTSGVVRAENNVIARLAATAVSVQQGRPTFILPRQLCWKCLTKFARRSQDALSRGTFIL